MRSVNKNPQARADRSGRWPCAGFPVFLALICGSQVAAQAPAPVVEARVRAFAQQAQRESRGDATALVLALDRQAREAWGEIETFPISIVRREDLLVTLSTPYMAYRRGVIDVLRTKRPIATVPWIDTAVVSVSPSRLGAPDIGAVILSRDRRDVSPTRSTLRTMTFSNGAGDQGVLHAGEVHFPATALAPGARVTLTVRPRDGEGFQYAFSDAELATLK